MDVFADQLPVLAPLLRRAAEAAYAQLGAAAPSNHRLEALKRVLALPEEGGAPTPLGDWASLATVVRENRPLRRAAAYHGYLDEAGANAARALWEAHPIALPAPSLLDIGGGMGTYATAFLRAYPRGKATLMEVPDVATRVPQMPGLHVVAEPFSTSSVTEPADVVLLANLLHMHGPSTAREVLTAAAARVAPGGTLLIKDYDPASRVGAYFDLSLSLYLEGGRLYPPATLCAWLESVDFVAQRHELGPAFVLTATAEPR